MAENPIGYLPDFPIRWGFSPGKLMSTTVIRYRGGRTQRKRNFRTGGLTTYTLSTLGLTQGNRKTLRDFLISLEGQLHSFYCFMPPEEVLDFLVGSVDDIAGIIIPAKDCVLVDVKVNDVSVVFAVTNGVGTGGETLITFDSNKTGAVTVTGQLRKRIVARLTQDEWREEMIPNAGDLKSSITLNIEEAV